MRADESDRERSDGPVETGHPQFDVVQLAVRGGVHGRNRTASWGCTSAPNSSAER